MQKPVKVHDKYSLRSLHQEIDLYDRKLAHLAKFETADAGTDQEAIAKKLLTKRESLARTARKLAADGIEFNPADLPRSFRMEAEPTPAAHE
jgi:hypothetical protein